MAAIRKEAIGLPFGKRRIGEQRGGERLEGKRSAELLHHVRLTRIVEIGLDGAGAQHHVQSKGSDARHMPHHDGVAAFRHYGQFVTALVWPHPKPKESDTQLGADFLHLLQVPTSLATCLMKVLNRGAGKLQLAGRLQADRSVRAGHGDDIAALFDGCPAIFAQRKQDIADSTAFVIGGRPVIVGPIDELFMLRPDPPGFRRLLAPRQRLEQLLTALDPPFFHSGRRARAHGRAVRSLIEPAPAQKTRPVNRRGFCYIHAQSPLTPIQSATAAMAAVSPRRMRGPSEMDRAAG